MSDRKYICIYGASSDTIDSSFTEAAYLLGELIAEHGYGLICGGGKGGLMAAAIEGCLNKNGEAIGVLPSFMIEKKWQHPKVTKLIVTPDMHTRKQTMIENSIAAIGLPGGIGTLEELMEIITWKQLKLYSGKVIILNTNSYYAPLLEMLNKMSLQGFMRKRRINLWSTATTPDEVMALILK